MEKQMVFHVLGIDETKDEQIIRDVYRARLKTVNPEDDPEGFKRLREAYETALRLARQPEEDGHKEKTLPQDATGRAGKKCSRILCVKVWTRLFR